MFRAKEKQLAEFLCATGKDNKGRTLREILSKDDAWWENTHDFVQWVFPTDEPSRFNFIAPLVSVPVRIEAPFLPESYARFRNFLHEADWAHVGNHNLMRITRVLRSLTLFGYHDLATEFYEELVAMAQDTPEIRQSLPYWEKAMRQSA